MNQIIDQCLFGDARERLQEVPDGTAQTCITSPPYFGLRDYGHADQIGLEDQPRKYVQRLVEVFREVRRVLRDDGTLWLNLGDSYATGGRGGGGSFMDERRDGAWQGRSGVTGWRNAPDGLKHKDLVGIPWRVAFALQDDGWYLRQDIIWSKPNPMPESVMDRCTKSHEYLFLLSKSPSYYYDKDAIAEASATDPSAPKNQWGSKDYEVPGQKPQKRRSRSGNTHRKTGIERGCPDDPGRNQCGSVPWEGSTRNKRSVWSVSTRPYPGAHFAVFPPALIEPSILAGSGPEDIVLDPFMGSGTTAEVAQRLGRHWLGCELNAEYEPLIRDRTRSLGMAI